jgi:hypothetical protein
VARTRRGARRRSFLTEWTDDDDPADAPRAIPFLPDADARAGAAGGADERTSERAGQAASSGTSCVERDKLPGFQGDRRADGPVRRHRRGGMRRRNEEGPGHRDRSPPPPDGAAVGTTSTAWRAEKSEQSPLQRAGGHGVTARVEFPALYAGNSTQKDSERDAIRVPSNRRTRTSSRARARSTSSRQAISTSGAASRVARSRPRGVARETPSRNAVAERRRGRVGSGQGTSGST